MCKVGPTEIRYSIAWTNCGGMINQQTIFVYLQRGQRKVNRNIVRYNKYFVFVTVVVVFVSYCYSYCDFVRTLYSRYWFVQVQVLVPYLFYFQKKV